MGEFVFLSVQFLDALNCAFVGLVIQVQTVGLNVRTKELEAVLIGLVVEFLHRSFSRLYAVLRHAQRPINY